MSQTTAEAAELSAYEGPIIDAFLHTPWLGGEGEGSRRADNFDWIDDRRLERVMHTFQRGHAEGAEEGRLDSQALLAAMDRSGVERAILPAKVYYGASLEGVRAVHRQIADLVISSNGRLKGVGTIVPPELGPGTYWDVMQTVRLIRELHEQGFVGLHLTPAPWGMPPNHKWFFPAFAACAELDLTVFVHVGMPGPLWPMSHQAPEHLDEVALAFPSLRIIAHHIGDPWTDVAVRLAARHPNFYICTSAWSPKRYPEALLEFLNGQWHGTPGRDKVIFASDFPLLDLLRATGDARRLPFASETLAPFLHGNASRLFWPSQEMNR